MLAAVTPAVSRAQLGDTTPSRRYFLGIEELYRGEYRDAYRILDIERRGAVRTVTSRWIDSIAYHAQLGEVLYHQGDRAAALEQFNFAASMYLQFPDWLLQVDFNQPLRADATLARRIPPWGAGQRKVPPGYFPTTMKISQGRIDNSNVVREGGVVVQAQYWQVNAVEILRATALTIRRRNELLGPLTKHDAISRNVLSRLSKGGAPPNHWSNAWIDVLRGLAHSGMGETQQALARLERGLVVAGQFDHPLTSFALLEQGRLMMIDGNASEANRLFGEAAHSAFVFEDWHIMDEVVRLASINRLASGATEVDPALQPASLWARRDRLDHIYARIKLAQADQSLASGNLRKAGGAFGEAKSRMSRDIQAGVLGNWALFLAARLDYAAKRGSALATLRQAIEGQMAMSPWNLQIALAGDMFDSRAMSSAAAVEVYLNLLDDPLPVDTAFRPLETLAVMRTDHGQAFDRWLAAMLERRNNEAALEVVDRSKRRRFHQALAWGGRLAAVRHLVAAPQADLKPEALQVQHDLLTRYPDLGDAYDAAEAARQQLDEAWQPGSHPAAAKESGRAWSELTRAVAVRESLLGQIAADRVPADYVFPPLSTAAEIQAKLQPGQAIMVFHDTPSGLLGFLFTQQESTQWNCGPLSEIDGLISAFLRDLGNYDANREMTADALASEDWKKSGAILYDALTRGSFFDPLSTRELIVVPDGAVWYVPFEALTAASEESSHTLVEVTPVRYAPTAALAVSNDRPWRRVRRTGLHVGSSIAGKNDQLRQQYAAELEPAVVGLIEISEVPAPSPRVAGVLDGLIVLDDIVTEVGDPMLISPLPIDRRGEEGALAEWMTLAGSGPQRIVLPGMRTIAERGGKASRRRGATLTLPGRELFLTSCSLMSAGAETLLLSRWRVGGESMVNLTREFVQELPFAAPADAWQRSVQLARETPIDPLSELRVKTDRDEAPLTASHPFFWSGYLVLDTGAPPPKESTDEELIAN